MESREFVRASDSVSLDCLALSFEERPDLGEGDVMTIWGGSFGLRSSYTSPKSAPEEIADMPREKSTRLPIWLIDSPRLREFEEPLRLRRMDAR